MAGVGRDTGALANVQPTVLLLLALAVMHPRHYRLRFAIDVLKNVFAPQIFLAIVFSLCRFELGRLRMPCRFQLLEH